MNFYNTKLYEVWHQFTGFVSSISWFNFRRSIDGRGYSVTDAEQEKIKSLLQNGQYLILTQSKSHLSSWIIRLMSYIATGEFATYSHVLMNSHVGTTLNADGFKLIEATNKGVHVSDFHTVFDCDNVCIISADLTEDEWKIVMAALQKQVGKSYDDFFNLKDDSHVSCVEMCLVAFQALPDFESRFPNLISMIDKVDQLIPEMYRDCQDFKVVFESKH